MSRPVYFWNNVENSGYNYTRKNGNLYMSPEEVTKVAYDAGFRGEALLAIVAIAGRESGYSPVVHASDATRNSISGDRGLWQINYIHDQTLVDAGIISSATPEGRRELFDPLVNARAAFLLSSNGSNFSPWNAASGGYNASGSWDYATNIPKAAQAVRNAGFGDEIASWTPQSGRAPNLFPSLPTPTSYPTYPVFDDKQSEPNDGTFLDILNVLRTVGTTENVDDFYSGRENSSEERPLGYTQPGSTAPNTIDLSSVLTPAGQQTVGGRTPYVPESTTSGQNQESTEDALARAEFGVGGPSNTEAAFAEAEFGVGGPAAGRTESLQEQALAEAEYGVGGLGLGRETNVTAPGGYTDVSIIPDTTMTAENWEMLAAEFYPAYWAIVQNNPEVRELLRQSITEGWERTKFEAKLFETNWWKTTSESARTWDVLVSTDPAEADRLVQQQITDIRQTALSYGVRLTDSEITELATDAKRGGFTPQQIVNAIGMLALERGTEGMTSLKEGYYGQQMRKFMSSYGVTLSDNEFNNRLNEIAVGAASLDEFQDYAMGLGKTMYPALAEQFDAGKSFEQLTDMYRQKASQVLEIDADSMTFTDDEWRKAVSFNDEKTGEERMMTYSEWTNYLRSTPSFGYEYTSGAKEKAYTTANRIANIFGKI
jgi:hypothetical protein